MKLFNKKIVNDTAFLSAAGYLNQFFHFIRGFIIARLLDPTLFGYLSGARLVLLFTTQMHFGALHGMTREFSIYKGMNDNENFKKTKNNGVSLITIFSTFIVVGIILYTFFVQDKYSPYIIWGIRAFATIAFIRQSISICHALLRVDYRFTEINTSRIVQGFSSLVLAVVLVLWFGLYGAFLSSLLASILTFSYLVKRIKIDFKFDLDKKSVKNLLLIGAPISFFYFNAEILNGISRLMIINFLSVKQLGYYAIALPFINLINTIPRSVSYILYPKMLETYGSSDKKIKSTQRYFQIPTQLNAVIIAFAVGILFLSIKYVFFYLLPRYTEAVTIVRILSFTTFFYGIRILAIRVLITQKSFKILFIFQVVAILVNIVFNLILMKIGYGIIGVAITTVISYIIYTVLTLHYTLSQFYQGFCRVLLNQLKLYWPIVYVGIILLGMSIINIFNVDVIRGLTIDIYQLAINLFIFSFLTIPSFIIVNIRSIKKIA